MELGRPARVRRSLGYGSRSVGERSNLLRRARSRHRIPSGGTGSRALGALGSAGDLKCRPRVCCLVGAVPVTEIWFFTVPGEAVTVGLLSAGVGIGVDVYVGVGVGVGLAWMVDLALDLAWVLLVGSALALTPRRTRTLQRAFPRAPRLML
jgi:hypothetical protein